MTPFPYQYRRVETALQLNSDKSDGGELQVWEDAAYCLDAVDWLEAPDHLAAPIRQSWTA